MKNIKIFQVGIVVWWRFFWRYAIIFVFINSLLGCAVNYFGNMFPKQLYLVLMLAGFFANAIATFASLNYCINRKFKNSSLILSGGMPLWDKLWMWFLYFWRFMIIAFVLGFVLGALLPFCFQIMDIDPIKALQFSKFSGTAAIAPSSYLAFMSLIYRKGKLKILNTSTYE